MLVPWLSTVVAFSDRWPHHPSRDEAAALDNPETAASCADRFRVVFQWVEDTRVRGPLRAIERALSTARNSLVCGQVDEESRLISWCSHNVSLVHIRNLRRPVKLVAPGEAQHPPEAPYAPPPRRPDSASTPHSTLCLPSLDATSTRPHGPPRQADSTRPPSSAFVKRFAP